MSFQLHIERSSGEIKLDEWKSAVAATRGVRLHPGEFATDSAGATIRFGSQDGDVEVFFPDQKTWHLVFRWSHGFASFTPTREPGDPSYPAWTAALSLAKHLQAKVRSDSGELFE